MSVRLERRSVAAGWCRHGGEVERSAGFVRRRVDEAVMRERGRGEDRGGRVGQLGERDAARAIHVEEAEAGLLAAATCPSDQAEFSVGSGEEIVAGEGVPAVR